MRLINLTFKKYPAQTADAIYVREMSKGFSKELGENYLLVVLQNKSKELDGVSVVTTNFFSSTHRSVLYFFWIPFFIIFRERWGKERVLFSADRFLMLSLIFWKKVLFFQYRLCVDWHTERGTWKEGVVLRYAEKHITTTNHLRKRLISKYGISPEKVKAMYGGFKPEIVSVSREGLGLPKDKKLIAYVGLFRTLGMEKGLKTMIESITFSGSNDWVVVAVGGTKEEIEYYKKYARDLKVLERCIFIERVSTDKVLEYESLMDVLVIPYPDKDHFRNCGFPMKAYEYMASGVPVVYSRLDIIHEVLGGLGTPFVPDDPKDLADKINAIIENSSKFKRMSDEARRVASSLTWNDKARNIINYIDER